MEAAAVLGACSDRTGIEFTMEDYSSGKFKKHLNASDFDILRQVSCLPLSIILKILNTIFITLQLDFQFFNLKSSISGFHESVFVLGKPPNESFPNFLAGPPFITHFFIS